MDNAGTGFRGRGDGILVVTVGEAVGEGVLVTTKWGELGGILDMFEVVRWICGSEMEGTGGTSSF